MQMFFLRNMMGIFIAVLIFTTIAIGVVVMRARTSAPDVAPQNETIEMVPETPSADFFDPMETPEQRLMDELDGLDTVPNGEGASAQPEVLTNPQEAATPNAPFPAVGETSSVIQNNDALADSETEMAVVPQEPAVPNAPPPPSEGTVPENNGTVSANEVPIRFESKAMIVKPKLIKATLKFEEDDGTQREPEDPNDPTSEGTGPGGRHKPGKVVNINTIPIIRMGENIQEQGAFKVIKPLYS